MEGEEMKQIVHKISGIVLVLLFCAVWVVVEYLSIRDGLRGIGTAWIFFALWTVIPIFCVYLGTEK